MAQEHRLLAEIRQATARYLDVERARADGFVQISGMEPRHGYHFARVDAGASRPRLGRVRFAAP